MVCQRCILLIKLEAEKLGLNPTNVLLGELELKEKDIPGNVLSAFDMNIQKLGFKRIDRKKDRVVEKIKNVIIQHIHHNNEIINKSWREIISSEMNYEYNYLSNVFSSVEGITLKQYVINQRVEKVKELLFNEEYNLNEIAFQMGYSSSAYLSNQFKKNTGMTPRQYTELQNKNRKSLENL